ncbi:MAG: CvpA family protein [Clostridia bacterium]|nr:CvpA family protein [Clostridia bacterium]
MNPSLIIDIALCVISLILIIRYTCKGAIRSILSYIKVFLAMGIAYMLRNPVASLINKMFMQDAITNWVQESLYATAKGMETDGVNFVELYQDTPAFFTNILSKFGMDLEGFDSAIAGLPYASDEQITALSENIGASVSLMLSMLMGIVIVFILALIILTVLVNVLDKVAKLPGLNFVNRLLGACIGVLISLTIIWATSGIVTLAVNYVGPIFPEIFNEELIDNSVILRLLKGTNLTEIIKSYIA